MKYIIILSTFSIILENFISIHLNFLSCNFFLINILFIFDIFKNHKEKYFLTCLIIGFIYDLFFTNLFIYNGIIFLIIGVIIYYLLKNKKRTYKLYFICTLIIIFLYNILTYTIFNFFNYINYSIILLIKIIISYLFVNIIYMSFIYLIYNHIYNK